MNDSNISRIMKEGVVKKLEGGDTNHTFLLTHDNKKYILRKFSTKKEADYYIKICKKLSKHGFLPKIYYQKGRRALFEYIEGRDCNKEDAARVAGQVGRICGQINKLNNEVKYDSDKRFYSYVATLKREKLIDGKKELSVKNMYFSLKKKLRPKIALDANDVYPENFRLRKGKVYLVDIEAIKPLFQGHGIAKSFIRWFKTPEQRRKFKQGYHSIRSINFLTEDYLKFLYLNFFVRSIAIRLRLKVELNQRDIERLNLLLEGN